MINEACKVKLEKGKEYYWCSCGKTAKEPFCDGSHKGTGKEPVAFKAYSDGDVYLCGCKKTKIPIYCDGAHVKK